MDKNSPKELPKPLKPFKISKKVIISPSPSSNHLDPNSIHNTPILQVNEIDSLPKEIHEKTIKKDLLSPPKSPGQQVRTLNRVKTLQLPKSPDHDKRIQGILMALEKNKKRTGKKEQIMFKKLSPREKVISDRQKKVLENSDKKIWTNTEHCLTERNLKIKEKLKPLVRGKVDNREVSRNNDEKIGKGKFYWYFNVRSPTPRQRMHFMPHNSRENGLYALVSDRENKKLSCSPRRADLDEFSVFGLCKIPLETEALKNRGTENLDVELIDRMEYGEIVEEEDNDY